MSKTKKRPSWKYSTWKINGRSRRIKYRFHNGKRQVRRVGWVNTTDKRRRSYRK